MQGRDYIPCDIAEYHLLDVAELPRRTKIGRYVTCVPSFVKGVMVSLINNWKVHLPHHSLAVMPSSVIIVAGWIWKIPRFT